MIGKLFLLAVVCVSLAQVHGDEGVENAIKRGLVRAKSINESGQKRISEAIKDVDVKRQIIQKKTEEFIQRSVSAQEQIKQALSSVAEATREKARESKKPQSVITCIDKAEENANNQIATFTNRLGTDLRRLEQVKLANIATDTKPLAGMEEALRVRYERAVKIINECDNARCVDTAVNSFARWLDLLSSDIGRIRGQVSTILSNFNRDANNYITNANRQITRVKSTGLRNIRQCLYNRENFLEEY